MPRRRRRIGIAEPSDFPTVGSGRSGFDSRAIASALGIDINPADLSSLYQSVGPERAIQTLFLREQQDRADDQVALAQRQQQAREAFLPWQYIHNPREARDLQRDVLEAEQGYKYDKLGSDEKIADAALKGQLGMAQYKAATSGYQKHLDRQQKYKKQAQDIAQKERERKTRKEIFGERQTNIGARQDKRLQAEREMQTARETAKDKRATLAQRVKALTEKGTSRGNIAMALAMADRKEDPKGFRKALEFHAEKFYEDSFANLPPHLQSAVTNDVMAVVQKAYEKQVQENY